MKGTASQITYSTAQFQGRTVYRTTENNPAGYPLSQSVVVTYQLWRYDTATAKWIKTNAVSRSGSFGTGGGSVGISGVNIQLQQHGWYSADVKIQWIGNNGNVIGQALYDYDLAADYACGCSTWQGTGIAAMYLWAQDRRPRNRTPGLDARGFSRPGFSRLRRTRRPRARTGSRGRDRAPARR